MADTLTAEMARLWLTSTASNADFAEARHVVIPAEELAKLRADASKLSLYDAAMDAIRDACDKIMGGNLDFIDDDFARCLYSMKAERDRLAGINRQVCEAIQRYLEDGRTRPDTLFAAIAAATK